MPAYTFSEDAVSLELRVPLPTGTRRNQLSITLHDDDSGANLWRAEIETAGGEERYAPRPRLRVAPAFWPEPLIDGVLRGPVDARESSYQLTASTGGDAWDCLVVSFRKAPTTEELWAGVLVGEEVSSGGDGGGEFGDALPTEDAARLVQRMAAEKDDARLQRQCAAAIAGLADAGRMPELLSAKALAQVAIAMKAHPSDAEIQASGCAVYARAGITSDAAAATIDAVANSQLLPACMSALLRHPAHTLVQLHGARALLKASGACEQIRGTFIANEGVALLTSLLQQPSPACDAACAALDTISRSGSKGVIALVHQGAAAALFSAIASPRASFSWRRRCMKAVLPIAEVADHNLVKSALASGFLPAILSLLSTAAQGAGTDEAACVLMAQALGALSWRGSSTQLRRALIEPLVAAGASRALINAAAAHPSRPGLRAAVVRLIGELTAPAPVEEKLLTAEEEQQLFAGEAYFAGRARKNLKLTPAAPEPKAPVDKRRLAQLEAEEEAKAADVDAGVAPEGGGLAEAGTFDGAVGISQSDAMGMLAESEAEAAAALEGAASEASQAVDAEVAFLLAFLDRRFGAAAGGGDGEMASSVAPAPPAYTLPTGPGDEADSSVSASGLLAARMFASAEVGSACEAAAFVEASAVVKAAAHLETETAEEQTTSLAVKILLRYAAAGELTRASLVARGALNTTLAALRKSRNHGERLWQLCGTLAHLSCVPSEQKILHESGAVGDLVELYEDALVAGIDADAHRLRKEVAICLANLGEADDGRKKDGILAAGGEEAIDEAVHLGTALEDISPSEIVDAVEKTPHSGTLLAGACKELQTTIDAGLGRAAVMLGSQAQAAADLVDAGVVRAVAAGLRRHACSDSVASAALTLLAQICRWQPRAALLLRRAHALEPAISILKRALEGQRAAATQAACDLLHAISVDQAVMPGDLQLTPALLDPMDVVPMLLQAAAHTDGDTTAAGADAARNSSTALTIRHACQALSWLAARFPEDETILGELGGGKGSVLRAALTTSLNADCSILAAESLARALHLSANTHGALVRDACGELRRQIVRRHRKLATTRFLGLGLVEVLLQSVESLGAGKGLGCNGLTCPTPDATPPDVSGLAEASSAAVGSVLALSASLSNDDQGLDDLKAKGALRALLPFLRAEHPPPQALLNGALLLANALRLRSGKGTLEQRLEEERIREREEAEGIREAAEAERTALLEAALPVLLRILRLKGGADLEALASALDALRKLATNPAAAPALLRHGSLVVAIDLVHDWPTDLAPLTALDASELVRLLLLAAAQPDSPSPPPPASVEDGDEGAAAPAVEAQEADGPKEPVAGQAGERLQDVLAWVGRISDAFPVPDVFTDEEKLQRGLCHLLCSLLSAAPLEAVLGHSELEALRPLLNLLKTQRPDPDLCATGCEALSLLSTRSVTLCKQVAKLQGAKTILLTMRQHIKKEEVQIPCVTVLRRMAAASDGCKKLVLEGHGVPMLCAVLKRHSLCPEVATDGAAALAALAAAPAGLKALSAEKEGVEVLVAAMLLCAREKLDFAAAKVCLQALADAEPALLKRINMANGKKWLRGAEPEPEPEVEAVAESDESPAAAAEEAAATGA